MRIFFAIVGTSALCAATAFGLQSGQSVVETPHNLSVAGPGEIRASGESEVCIFCHTPHNATTIQPLWNRSAPVNAYAIYSSNALDARPGQPTGASKMCLSCHDGTIALGSVVSRDQIIQMAGGMTSIPPGSGNLGTDLSDDHPVSFVYDVSLVTLDPKLAFPSALPPQIKLDQNGELQCTACHDPHDNSFSKFLVMSNVGATLCRSCHQHSTTSVAAHADCIACHRSHTAPSGPYLLDRPKIRGTCLKCHNGLTPGAHDVATELFRVSSHDTNSEVDPPDPIPGHSTCADCHEPHTMAHGTATAPSIQPTLGQVSGVSAQGAAKTVAVNEFEVCYKCHADDNAAFGPYISRQVTQLNTRLEFATNAISFHPVQGPGRNFDVPSLKPKYNTSSMIYCSDCHNSSNSGGGGGGGAGRGVHGSDYPPLLAARYDTMDFTPESASAYALCYQCHYRDGPTGVLSDVSFMHDKHVRDERTPCSVCHDPHGISSLQGTSTNNSHLINFDSTVVFPDQFTGRLEFVDQGQFAGQCFLSCHGKNHSPLGYIGGDGVDNDVLGRLR